MKQPPTKPPSPARLSAADYELLADFRYALRRFAVFSEGAAASLDLMPQQHQALLAIKGCRQGAPGRRGLYVGEIAERLLIRPHTAAELVGRLARLDLVSREADPADGRRVEVVLTAKAERMLEDLSASHLEELRAMRPLLTRLLARIGEEPGGS
ncbi:hypothetical protein D9M72_80890 [compost metagenome]